MSDNAKLNVMLDELVELNGTVNECRLIMRHTLARITDMRDRIESLVDDRTDGACGDEVRRMLG
jgi:hypothetical protein